MAMLTGNTNGPNADMNVTPLIDVLLVLLIIVMVITPIAPTGLEALIPQPPPNAPVPPDDTRAIVVQVLNGDDGAQLKINNEVVTWQRVEPRLRAIFATRAERVVFVKGDESIDFAEVAQVVNLAHSAGIDHVGLLTAKIEAAR